MKQPTKIALLGAGVGILSMAAVAVTSVVNAETTDTVDTAITTATTPTTVPPVGPGRHGGRHLEEMATELGLTTAQLQTELQSGKEFYQIATAQGLTFAELKAKRTEEVKARLADMVKVGFMTQAEADEQLKLHEERASSMPMLGMGGGRHGKF